MRNSFLLGMLAAQVFAQTSVSPYPPARDVIPPVGDVIRTSPARNGSGPPTRRNIYLSGRVVLDSGVPPPDPVPIECVCNGRSRVETYTDTKGKFSFRVGQNDAGPSLRSGKKHKFCVGLAHERNRLTRESVGRWIGSSTAAEGR